MFSLDASSFYVLIVTAAPGEDEAVRDIASGMLTPWRETDGPDGFGFKV